MQACTNLASTPSITLPYCTPDSIRTQAPTSRLCSEADVSYFAYIGPVNQ